MVTNPLGVLIIVLASHVFFGLIACIICRGIVNRKKVVGVAYRTKKGEHSNLLEDLAATAIFIVHIALGIVLLMIVSGALELGILEFIIAVGDGVILELLFWSSMVVICNNITETWRIEGNTWYGGPKVYTEDFYGKHLHGGAIYMMTSTMRRMFYAAAAFFTSIYAGVSWLLVLLIVLILNVGTSKLLKLIIGVKLIIPLNLGGRQTHSSNDPD